MVIGLGPEKGGASILGTTSRGLPPLGKLVFGLRSPAVWGTHLEKKDANLGTCFSTREWGSFGCAKISRPRGVVPSRGEGASRGLPSFGKIVFGLRSLQIWGGRFGKKCANLGTGGHARMIAASRTRDSMPS